MVATRTGRSSSQSTARASTATPAKRSPRPRRAAKDAEAEEAVEPLYFDAGQWAEDAAPEEDGSDGDDDGAADAAGASPFFIDTGADGDGGDDTVRVEFGAGKVEEMDAADYFGAVHAAIAAAKLDRLRHVGDAAARALDADEAASSDDERARPSKASRPAKVKRRECRYVDFDALEIRGDALDAAGGTADAALAEAAAAPPAGQGKKRRSKADKRAVPDTAGPGWFDMARSDKTAVSDLDKKALAFRGITDPKRFYKKQDALSPFAQVGTVVAGAFESKSQTLKRKDRKTSLMAELLADDTKRAYAKRKFAAIQEKARGPNNSKLKGKKRHAAKKRH